ncbi:2-aminoethylphosphonate--pyruvate transaminase [Pseudomonas sp. 7P_10.2_Bac1]|uniref:2-aminoethylphosphonate--pyruvate transaminase n=1 Tax=Pseudomonas sp. 7P_10.2_Bac1 TaxID=2971614 RepID=UPI0021C924E9|nr:2-aminoethylphosphonate--pyruvate transaminase [Pseudomonas sp. 7P_10.2_Bac1]MCU1727295.1 2-aminoethylphosphonate--pyruvate transaminase [Pseudomonas sp. 7P_10.2_Bac1]
MNNPTPLLLTPGPLSTAPATRAAMLRDWGSREPDFIALTRELCKKVHDIAQKPASHVVVPIQGSGTYGIEAVLSTLIKPSQRLLVLSNGAYGQRIAAIARRLGQDVQLLEHDERSALDLVQLERVLRDDPSISHVAMVHGETSAGRINPVEHVERVVAAFGRRLLVDAMSTFGAYPIALEGTCIAALIASCNKCLEGVPGIAFALVDSTALAECDGVSRTTSLDLYAQWQGFVANGQWRFTPPVQVVAAAVQALELHTEEGGVAARYHRYATRSASLLGCLRTLGIEPFLPADVSSVCITAFVLPQSLKDRFDAFVLELRQRGIAIYPGKLTTVTTFRIGCMGAFDADEWSWFLTVFTQLMAQVNSNGEVA